MAEPKKPFYRDRKWKLGGSFGVWHIPYCPHCKRQLGLMAEEQQVEKCPMCGKPLEWGGCWKWLSGEFMRQTLRSVPAVECGCRLPDTGVVKVRMRERSLTTAHTAVER